MFDAWCPCYGSDLTGLALLVAIPVVLLIVGALLHRRRTARQHDPLTTDTEVTRETPGAADGRR